MNSASSAKKRRHHLEIMQWVRGLAPAEITELLDLREAWAQKNREWEIQVGRLSSGTDDVITHSCANSDGAVDRRVHRGAGL